MSSLTAQDIIAVMTKAKELGVNELKVEGLELRVNAQSPVVVEKISPLKEIPNDLKIEDILAPSSPFDNMSDEELLYYATPYFDELQAKKELMAKQRKDDEDQTR